MTKISHTNKSTSTALRSSTANRRPAATRTSHKPNQHQTSQGPQAKAMPRARTTRATGTADRRKVKPRHRGATFAHCKHASTYVTRTETSTRSKRWKKSQTAGADTTTDCTEDALVARVFRFSPFPSSNLTRDISINPAHHTAHSNNVSAKLIRDINIPCQLRTLVRRAHASSTTQISLVRLELRIGQNLKSNTKHVSKSSCVRTRAPF
jgi:hypothetical protein